MLGAYRSNHGSCTRMNVLHKEGYHMAKLAKLGVSKTPKTIVETVEATVIEQPKVLPDLTKEMKSTTVPLNPIAASASGRNASAMAAAEKAEHDPEFTAEMVEFMKAGETVKRGPVVLLDRLMRLYGDELNSWPIVDSRKSDGGNLWDIYPVTVRKTDGTTKVDDRSWYADWMDDWCASLPQEDNINWHLSQLELSQANPPSGIYVHLSKDEVEYSSEKKMWKDRATAGLSALKKAMRIKQQMDAINTMKLVAADFKWRTIKDETQENGYRLELSRTTSPIKVWDRILQTESKNYTYSAFLLLKPPGSTYRDENKKLQPDPKAVDRNATLAELIASSSKGADEEETDSNETPALVNDVKTFENAATAIANYLERNPKAVAGILKIINDDKHPLEAEAMLSTVGDVCMAFDGLWTAIQPMYEAYQLRLRNKKVG
jgi:hypothetical protein